MPITQISCSDKACDALDCTVTHSCLSEEIIAKEQHVFVNIRYVKIMVHLCRAELAISFAFLAHGLTCPGYPKEAEYQSTCHMNTVAALVGLLTGALGLGAVHR
ncbi:unnamed protein product [Cylicostephanus goldi]|uniref:Uncharacterized protein n=1 Tax=Cylicostephanus goldi TaxID=71465 RepID=A0A3P7PHA7_CYLGO|nr:unnamed protein product [Cylicostephanus goldi]